MLLPTLSPLVPAVEDRSQNLLQPVGLEQPILDMAGDDAVELLHRDRAARAAGFALPRLDRAGVVAIAPALAGADGHGSTALGAEADAGQQGRPADHARRRDLGIAGFQMRLHGVEGLKVDQRWHRDCDNLADRLQFLGLGALVELVLADIGAPRQDAVKLADAPAPAVAGEDATGVEMADDRLDAHRAGRAVSFQRQPVDQPHGVGVQWIDLQLLLGLGPALLGRDDAVADRRQRAVPEALPGVLLQGAHDVLAVFLGLILVEQRHDLAHHDVHRVVAHLLRDRNQLDAVLRQLAHIEFQLEVIAEEAAERVDDDDIEGRGFGGARLDHALELGTAIVGSGRARLNVGVDKLIAARQAVGLTLALLVRDRDIMLGLPRGRDAEIQGSARGDAGCFSVHDRSPSAVAVRFRDSFSGKSSTTRS
nr:hypothetical protein [Pararhodospirillum photometricum]